MKVEEKEEKAVLLCHDGDRLAFRDDEAVKGTKSATYVGFRVKMRKHRTWPYGRWWQWYLF